MTDAKSRVLLVYNADGGIVNALKDAVWKIASPATYPCSLCAITYGAVSMHGRWRRFLAELPHETVFHHRDDFASAYPGQSFALPVILTDEGGGALIELVPARELDRMKDHEELIAVMKERLGLQG